MQQCAYGKLAELAFVVVSPAADRACVHCPPVTAENNEGVHEVVHSGRFFLRLSEDGLWLSMISIDRRMLKSYGDPAIADGFDIGGPSGGMRW